MKEEEGTIMMIIHIMTLIKAKEQKCGSEKIIVITKVTNLISIITSNYVVLLQLIMITSHFRHVSI
jgi:hypothetical protein